MADTITKPFATVMPLPEPCKVVSVYGDNGPSEREPVEDYYTAAQLRTYAASVARECLPESDKFPDIYGKGHNACRDATLSAIDEWEKNV